MTAWVRAKASFLAIAGCSAGTRTATPVPARPATPTMAEAVDAGLLSPCLPEGKDAAPCVEECNRGIAASCELLADRVTTGTGVPRDPTRALSLHERACELRDPAACVTAARMQGAGRGVAPNRQRQLELQVAACNLGDTTSCATAARAYAIGTGIPGRPGIHGVPGGPGVPGIPKDEARARALWQRACLGGDEPSCEEAEASDHPNAGE